MKKVALICALIALIVGCLCWFYQNQEFEDKSKGVLYVDRETEKYKQDCFNQSYPEDLSSINMYNDEMKCLDKKYHQCLKEVIIAKINELATKEDAQKMVDELNQFQESVLS